MKVLWVGWLWVLFFFFNSALFLEMTSLIRKYKPPSNLADT